MSDVVAKQQRLSLAGRKPRISPDSRLAPSQRKTSLQSNAVCHWLGTNLERALRCITLDVLIVCCAMFCYSCIFRSGSMWSIYPYPSGLLHWHWGNHMIAPVPVMQPWRIWVKWSGSKWHKICKILSMYCACMYIHIFSASVKTVVYLHCSNNPLLKPMHKADWRLVSSQWETPLHCNDVSHWLGASLESALMQGVYSLCS